MFQYQIPTEEILFLLLYGGAAMVALIASIYLILRRGNAFAPKTMPPLALRRWAAAFLATVFMSHVWWGLFYLYSGDIHSVICLIVAVLDCVALLITIPGMLFAMLQDRRRRVWPIITAVIPYIILGTLYIKSSDNSFLYMAAAYIILVYALISIYMVFAVRQYGRWLRDNYADLEHKEVWMSQILVLIIFVLIIGDSYTYNYTINNLVQIIEIAFFGFLLWRVETLPLLEDTLPMSDHKECAKQEHLSVKEEVAGETHAQIEQLLKEHCIGTELYLQHDLTLQQLAQAIGTNRTYLSQYFSLHGTTYNAYINDLRIDYFIQLYREAAAARQPIIAQRLALDSGYRSYTTFSRAFRQRVGESVTAWMHETD